MSHRTPAHGRSRTNTFLDPEEKSIGFVGRLIESEAQIVKATIPFVDHQVAGARQGDIDFRFDDLDRFFAFVEHHREKNLRILLCFGVQRPSSNRWEDFLLASEVSFLIVLKLPFESVLIVSGSSERHSAKYRFFQTPSEKPVMQPFTHSC